ncbi:MAG TPA: hypothetical protein VK177_08505 [Flavobacteriales bacterium]|nr:hypothetical protein [Flavobacteriales bacterium]
MKKIACILILFLLAPHVNAQTPAITQAIKNKPAYLLTITTLNHAERVFKGILYYALTNNELTIRRQNFPGNSDTLLFSKKTDALIIEKIKNMQFDNLDSLYINNCVMLTSGNEYFISITNATVSKKISLHHYYHMQVEKLVNEVNKLVPAEFKINYLKSETKQNCK